MTFYFFINQGCAGTNTPPMEQVKKRNMFDETKTVPEYDRCK